MRAAGGGGMGVGRDVIDLVLAFLRAREVVGQRHGLRRIAAMRRSKAQQLGDAFAVGRVFARAFLEHLAELGPEGRVVVLLVLGQVFQQRQDALGRPFANGAHVAAFLQNLARDVQRQVGRIDHPAHEAQVRRQQLFGVVHDEHALHIQLDAAARIAVPQVEGRVLGQVEQLGVFAAAFHAVVRPGQRVVEIVRDGLVELAVLLVGDVGLAARPQRAGLVHRLPLVLLHLLVLLGVPLLLGHEDGQRDVVGIAAQDLAQLPAVEQFVFVGAQVQRDVGAARGLVGGGDGEFALAVGLPADRVGRAGAAADHRDLVGHDERGIEAHAELADELGVFLLVARELREELARARAGDGAQVGDGLVPRQADAVVGNGDGARRLVVGHADGQIAVAGQQLGMVDGLEAQLVAGIGCVGNQLAQEDFLVAVKRVDHQVQQLLHFGLETQGFGGRGGGLAHGDRNVALA